MSGQESEGMEAWMIAGSPGEHHKRLEPMVGSWKARVTWWAAPGAPPQVSDGAMTAEWILGGRFVKETFESYSPEMPFQGLGLYGYDNLRGKYHSTWVDSMSTGIMVSEGTSIDSGTGFEFEGEYVDAGTKEPVKTRMVLSLEDQDRHVFTMYEPTPEGGERKGLEIVYSRV